MTKEHEQLLADIFSLLSRYVDDEIKPDEIETETMLERILDSIEICPKCSKLMEGAHEVKDEYICTDCYASLCDATYDALKDGEL